MQNNDLVNSSGRACVTDFGLSGVATAIMLSNSPSTVSFCWTAPELLSEDAGARSSKASDIWALGCVCYEVWPITPCVEYSKPSDVTRL